MDSKLSYNILTDSYLSGNYVEADSWGEGFDEYRIGINPNCDDEFIIEDSIGRFTIIRLENIEELTDLLLDLKELQEYN